MEGRASPVVPQVYDRWPKVSDQQLQALLTALEAGKDKGVTFWIKCYYSSSVMDDLKKNSGLDALHTKQQQVT